MARSILQSVAASVVIAAGSTVALAQFSNDPFAPEVVCDNSSDLSKIAMMADGSFYVSWNQTGTGYDIRLQKYNAAGVEQWAHNGVLVGDRGLSGVSGDYELRADASGNAYLAFPQDGTNTRVVKVDGAGATVWSSIVSPDQNSKIGARMALLSDGNLAVAWLEGTTMKIQRASGATGAPVGTIITVSETGHNPSPCDMQAGDNGSFIVSWIRPFSNSFGASRYIRAQKFDAANNPVWPDVVTPTPGVPGSGSPGMIIYQPSPGESYPNGGGNYNATQGGSLGNGYFPYFMSDGAGGAVFYWYENAGTRTAFVQQVSADGTKRWNTNYGRPVNDTNGTGYKLSCSADYDPATHEIYVSWVDSNTLQSQFGTSAQKINADGSLAWGAVGTVVSPLDTKQESFLYTVRKHSAAGGCYLINFEAQVPGGAGVSANVEAAYLDANGVAQWDPAVMEVCSQYTSKGRLWVAGTPHGGAVMTYDNGATLALSNIPDDVTPPACAADLGVQGGLPGSDGMLDNNDFIAFISYFFDSDPHADLGVQGGLPGQDGMYDNNDFIAFISLFFDGCS